MRRLGAALAGLLVGVLGMSGLPATHAATLLTAESVALNIATMTPVNPQPGRTLRLSGTLRNRSNQAITALQVRLLLSGSPLDYRSQIGEVVAGSTLGDGAPTLAVSEPIASLDPRGTVTWSIERPVDELPLSAPGVYVAGLEVIGTGTDGLTQRFGLTRTFLPWYPEGSVAPTRLAWLWPVTTAPDRALDGVQLTEQTATEMAPGGRLARLAESAGTAQITWVIDPSVLQTAEDMADGYEIGAAETGAEAPAGSGGPVAQQWLNAIRQDTTTQTTMATSYAMPDAVALQRAQMPGITVGATRQAAQLVSDLTRTRVDSTLAWPIGGYATPAVLRSYQNAGATDLLLADTSFPPTPELGYTTSGFTTWSGMPVTLADSGLGAALAMPQNSRAEAVLARQRFLAEVALTSSELPTAPRGIVAAPDPLWSPRTGFLRQTLRALDQVPYAELVTLDEARKGVVDVTRTRQQYGPEQRSVELPQDYLDALKPQRKQARQLGAIVTDPTALGYEQALMRQASSAWRANLGAGTELVNAVSEQLRSRTAKVRVASEGTFTLPGDAGRIPVTVANDLEQDVTVGIRLVTDEPARLAAQEVAPFIVPAGRKVSVEVEAQVVGAGTLPVRIQLTTPQGKRYGEPVTVQVRTTAYSQAAAYVVSGAFVILAFLLGMNFVRRRRAKQETP